MERFSADGFDAERHGVLPDGEPVPWTGAWIRANPGVGWIDIRTIDRFCPPTPGFILRSHRSLRVPDEALAGEWQVRLEGCFREPAVLTLDEIKRYPIVTRPVAIECSGNSFTLRATFWEMAWYTKLARLVSPGYWWYVLRMLQRKGWCTWIGNAVFTGVRLLDVLEDHPLSSEARELVFYGRDEGIPTESRGWAPGLKKERYGRALAVEELARFDPLLCFAMNGEPLAQKHGFPLRMVVPGVFGSEWTKWLGTIEAIPDRFTGFYDRNFYNNRVPAEEDGKRRMRSVRVHEMVPKSTVVRVIRRDGNVEVYGVAWGGFHALEKVEVSLDRGESWTDAELLYGEPSHSWVMWRYTLRDPPAGRRHTLLPRAWDTEGVCQPLKTPWYQHYANNSILPADFST